MNNTVLKLHRLLLSVLTAATLAGCSTEETDAGQPRTWKVSVETGGGDDLTRALLSVSGSTMTAAWQTSDNVKVYKNSTQVGTLTPRTATASATLTGNLTGTFAKNDQLKLYWPDNTAAPDYTAQDGTLASISSKDYVEATVTVTEVHASEGILATTYASFTHRQSFTKFTFSESVQTVKISASGMSDITVTASGNQKDFYVALPLEGSVSYTFVCTTADETQTYRGTKTGNLTHGKYYTATVDVAPGVGVTNTSSWGGSSSWSIGNIYF